MSDDKRTIKQLRLRGTAPTLAVVFGDQLDAKAASLHALDRARDAVLMMEVREEATHVASHKQRTAVFFSAMRHFALELHGQGYRVHYVCLDSTPEPESFDAVVTEIVKALSVERIVVTRPGEWRVLEKVERWRDALGVRVDVFEDRHFYTTPDEFADWAAGRKQLVLEYFYREMRKRFGVLMEKGGRKPIGGEWNYDKQNRERYNRAESPPPRRRFRPDAITQDVLTLVAERFPDAPGELDGFDWPVTQDEARTALKHFIQHRLPDFGTYQDAMVANEPWMFHAQLSPMFNLKRLDPREAVAAAVEAYEQELAPLNAVEGFVRQLLGWREFIRGVYWTEGPNYGARNGLRQYGELPALYWTGETDMHCMQQCVGEVVSHGYGHHIQRLMVTGNFALIAGVHPRAISDWYLAMYVDAVDWVTLPNTLGMVMHADGGVVGTKPYAASGKYIKRMSNYCDSCRYNVNLRDGDDACPFNTFYWDFLIRNQARFKDNNRMAMVLKNVERMDGDERDRIQRSARQLRQSLGIGGITR